MPRPTKDDRSEGPFFAESVSACGEGTTRVEADDRRLTSADAADAGGLVSRSGTVSCGALSSLIGVQSTLIDRCGLCLWRALSAQATAACTDSVIESRVWMFQVVWRVGCACRLWPVRCGVWAVGCVPCAAVRCASGLPAVAAVRGILRAECWSLSAARAETRLWPHTVGLCLSLWLCVR